MDDANKPQSNSRDIVQPVIPRSQVSSCAYFSDRCNGASSAGRANTASSNSTRRDGVSGDDRRRRGSSGEARQVHHCPRTRRASNVSCPTSRWSTRGGSRRVSAWNSAVGGPAGRVPIGRREAADFADQINWLGLHRPRLTDAGAVQRNSHFFGSVHARSTSASAQPLGA